MVVEPVPPFATETVPDSDETGTEAQVAVPLPFEVKTNPEVPFVLGYKIPPAVKVPAMTVFPVAAATVIFDAPTAKSPENVFAPATVWAVVKSTKFCVADPVPPLATDKVPENLASVTAPLANFTVVMALSEMTGAAAVVPVPPKSPAKRKIPFVVVVASAAIGITTELLVPERVIVDPTNDKVCVSVVIVFPGAHCVPSNFNTWPVVGAVELNVLPCNFATKGDAAVPPKSPSKRIMPFVDDVASAAMGITTELFVPEIVNVEPTKPKVCVSVMIELLGT